MNMMEQILDFFVSKTYADTVGAMPGPGAQGSSFSFVLMFVVLILFIYFGVWRPQSKRVKEQQNLLNALSKGDEIVTGGGLLGRISKINDQYIVLAIANNVEIVVQKASVISILPKGTLKSIE